MRIEEYREEYQIREFQMRRQNAQTVLGWKFKQSSHFLIFMYDSRYEFSLESAMEQLESADIDDKKIVDSKSSEQIFDKENGKFKLFCIREKEFLRGNKSFTLPSQEIKRGVPYEISVFACSYDIESRELSVFKPKRKTDNLQYIPVVIQPEIRYEKKLFAKQTTCILRVPHLEDYKDGAIMYHVDNVRAEFPLPASCLGRDLYIMVPDKDTVTVRIREEYKNYYKKN